MKTSDRIMGIIWILLGLTITVWSATFPLGTLRDPGPGLLPLACGVVTVFLGTTMLIRAKPRAIDSHERSTENLFPRGKPATRVILTTVAILVSTILFVPMGFVLTVFFLVLFLMRAIEPQRWTTALLYAFFSATGAFIVFKVLLKSQLPSGFLGI